MSKTERIYALLVEANPVPDPNVLPERFADVEPHPHVVDTEGTTMHTDQTSTTLTPEPRRRPAWIPLLVAAIVVIVVGAVGVFVLADDGGQPQPEVSDSPATTVPPPATTLPPDPAPDVDADAQARADAAVARADAYFVALNAGDVDAAVALMAPDGTISEADQRMLRFNAAYTARYPWEVEPCETTVTPQGVVVFVECAMVYPDPVWVAEAVSEVVFPWQIYDDGRMDWLPFKGADFSKANQAYAGYLEIHHPDEYAAVCNPAAYDPGTVNHDRGFALTEECAAVALPLAEEIAAWVEAGKPES